MGIAGRARAETTYSWRAVAEATALVYRDVLSVRAGAQPEAGENAA